MNNFINKEQAADKSYILKVLQSAKLPFVVSDISNFEVLTGGSRSVAVRIDEYIIRFPRNEEVFENQKREALISQMLNRHLSVDFKNKITNVKIADGFAYHKMLKGRIFDKSITLSKTQEDNLAYDIAEFLNDLHRISITKIADIDKTTIPRADNWNFTGDSEWNYETAKSLLQTHHIDLDEFKMGFNDRDRVICHNDLSGSNVLLNNEQLRPLQAVIDFGNVAVMPRSNEFVPFYKISRRLALKIMNFYNQISPDKVNVTEVDYKALSFIGKVLIASQNKESYFSRLMIENFKN